jgi:predicted XRE-type DNA-binding protein
MQPKEQRLRKRREYCIARHLLRSLRQAQAKALENKNHPDPERRSRKYPFEGWQAEINVLSAVTAEYEMMVVDGQRPDHLSSRHPLTHELDLPHTVWLLRKACGLKQAELAALLKVTQALVSTCERAGYTGQTLSYLVRLAAALGYEIDVVFTRQAQAE